MWSKSGARHRILIASGSSEHRSVLAGILEEEFELLEAEGVRKAAICLKKSIQVVAGTD